MDEVARRIALAAATGLAMASSGCGPSIVISDGDDGGGTSAAGDDGADDQGSATSGSNRDDGDDGGSTMTPIPDGDDGSDDDGDDPSFDVGGMPPPPDPVNRCFDIPPDVFGCDVKLGPDQLLSYFCVQAPPDIPCEELSEDAASMAAQRCLGCGGGVEYVACGPESNGASCCSWIVHYEGQICPGRPFTVEGLCRLAAIEERDDWRTDVEVDLESMSVSTRQALATAWAHEGCFEAASVASFSRFILELLAIGAPPQLIDAAQQAIGEEVGHARAFFGLASAYGGRSVGPGALDIEGSLHDSGDRVAIAVALAREGCIGETVSAMQLQIAAQRCADPKVQPLLLAIAEEELQHAELAWRAMGWMLDQGDDTTRAAVAAVFARAENFVPEGSSASDALDAAVVRRCGRLSRDERLALAARALTDLVAPAATTLLRRWTVAAPVHNAEA